VINSRPGYLIVRCKLEEAGCSAQVNVSSNPQHHNPGRLLFSSDTANLLRSAWPGALEGTYPNGPHFAYPVVAGAPKVGSVVPLAKAAVKRNHDAELDKNSASDESHHRADNDSSSSSCTPPYTTK
jgi:hypothetical protein